MCQVDREIFEPLGNAAADGVLCVRAGTDLDLLTASRARDQLIEISSAGPITCLVVELGVDRFVDLHGMRALHAVGRLLRSRGVGMVLVSTSYVVTRVQQMMQSDDALPVVATVAAARRAVRAGDDAPV